MKSLTMKVGLSPEIQRTTGMESVKLRIIVLLFAAQLVMSTRMSILLPSRDTTTVGLGSKAMESRNLKADKQHVHHFHHRKSIRIRGGGTGSTKFGSIPAFFRDSTKPMAREANERLRQRMDSRLEQKSSEREAQRKRNKIWREVAENPMHFEFSSSYASSSSQSESSHVMKSSSYSQTRTPLQIRSLKLSFAALVVTEILDRTGILQGDTLDIFWARIVDFWETDVLRAYGNVRSQLVHWYDLYAQKRLSNYRSFLRRFGSNVAKMSLHYRSRLVIPTIWPTIKIIFASSMICGVTLTPWLYSWLKLLWKPTLIIVATSEINHYCKMRGRKFVEVLGETPRNLGVVLDVLLERLRKLLWNLIHKINGSELENDIFYEGYGSGSSNRGAVDDRYGDSISMGLMGGDVVRNDRRRKSNRSKRDSDIYSLGISAYQDDEHAFDLGFLRYDKRRRIAIQGLLWGYALGIVLKASR